MGVKQERHSSVIRVRHEFKGALKCIVIKINNMLTLDFSKSTSMQKKKNSLVGKITKVEPRPGSNLACARLALPALP